MMKNEYWIIQTKIRPQERTDFCLWSFWPESNRWPHPYQGCALPTEPQKHHSFVILSKRTAFVNRKFQKNKKILKSFHHDTPEVVFFWSLSAVFSPTVRCFFTFCAFLCAHSRNFSLFLSGMHRLRFALFCVSIENAIGKYKPAKEKKRCQVT